jgi:signal transduction histidine kinase
VVITTLVTLARLNPALGEGRHGIAVVTLDDLHEGQVEIAAAMVLALVAAVLWGRLHRAPTRRHLLLFTSFSVLAVDNLVSALFTASFDSLSASQFATWATAGTGLLGALLVGLAAWLPDEPLERPRHDVLTTLGQAASALAVILALAWVLRSRLPQALELLPTFPAELDYFSAHPVLIASDALAAACWAAAAVLFAVASRRTGDHLTQWMALGGLLVAVSCVNYALVPSHLIEMMYLGDYFFLCAVGLLLVAAVREVGAAEAALVDRALHAERRRIAREMHDGVTQELAFIAFQAQTAQADPERAGRALRRIRFAVERALDQSRTAIAELSGPVDETLAGAIAMTVEVVSRRTGARVELTLDESLVVTEDVRLALIQVTRDALNLAARGGAEEVRIDLRRNHKLGLRFSAEIASTEGTTHAPELTSIRERVAALDGEVNLNRGPAGASTLEVLVP